MTVGNLEDLSEKSVRTAEELEKALLGHVAEIQALRVALSKHEPKHPLLTNQALRQRIQAAGAGAFGFADSEEQARRFGAGARY